MDTIEVPLHDEGTGRHLIVKMTPQEFERAKSDTRFFAELVQTHYDQELQGLEGNEDQGTFYSQDVIIKDDQNSAVATNNENINVEGEGDKSLFIWNNDCIHLLLSLYEEHKEDFKLKRHKKVFDEIAKKMLDTNALHKISGGQCQSKIFSLKKTFKKIKDHNNTSGNDRATWPYFERMQELYGRAVWIKPRALASESGPAPEIQTHPSTLQPKKLKIDSMIEELLEDRKRNHSEKQAMFEFFLHQRQKQHEERMGILFYFISEAML